LSRFHRSVTFASALAISTLFFAGRAAADDAVVQGTVTWDVVHAAAGTISLFGQTFGARVEVPLVINPGGLSGSYTTTLPTDDYGAFVAVGDCAAAATEEDTFTCPNWLFLSATALTSVIGAGPFEIDVSPPAGFGAVAASGTATLNGSQVVGGTASFGYFQNDASASISAHATSAVDVNGHYAAPVGSGFVFASVEVQQGNCAITQFLFASASDVPAGSNLVLDTSGDGLPPAPAAGAINLDFGVTGVADALGRFGVSFVAPEQDCGGGWNDPHLFDVLAGAYPMAHFDTGSTAISPGTYRIFGDFSRHPSPTVRTDYQYADRNVTVASSQTAEADFRFAPAFVRGTALLDWSQFGPLSTTNDPPGLRFEASAPVPSGSIANPDSTWTISDDATGVHNYTFELPIDPARSWSFSGAFFSFFLADGTFLNLSMIPGVSTRDVAAPVPPLAAGQSTSYDLTNLLKVKMGHVEFAPRTQPGFGPFLTDTSFEVVPGLGVRYEFARGVAPFGAPSALTTVTSGQKSFDADWFDASFNPLHESVTLDVRPTETVSLTDSAPRLDDVQPVPGIICKQSVKVTGRATDPDRIASVTVNGVEADVKNDGTFTRNITIPAGDSVLVVRAADRLGNSIVRSRPLHRNGNNTGCN
jgi:hypothetical protein